MKVLVGIAQLLVLFACLFVLWALDRQALNEQVEA